MDTGSTYTLLNEHVWDSVKAPEDKLTPWIGDPLYLADGEPRIPLGWSEMELSLQDKTWLLAVVVLDSKTLAFPALLGLDFVFFTGMQIDVSGGVYWFRENEKTRFAFCAESSLMGEGETSNYVAFFSVVAPSATALFPTLTTLEDSDLFQKAIQESHLEEHRKPQLKTLLLKNADVCTTKMGRTDILKHQIFLTNPLPIQQKPYRVSPPKLKVMKELIDDMLKDEVIEPSCSAWASPVVLIPRKVGKPRFCVDFRKVNENTVTDAYPIPTIQEILDSLSGAAVFSSLDLNSGYWQVEMDPEVREITAFICPQGLFQFKVMPFGLKNAPATFQRLMERALGELKGVICFVYLDDIIIFSQSWEQHFYDVQAVLDKLQSAGLSVNMKKSKLCRTSLRFLGHIVSATGVHVDPDKTEAVRNFPVPINLKALQRFLGMAGWYHRFVPNFSQIAEPLNALKKKGARFLWSPACQTAFETLKEHLVNPPVLGHPNFHSPFVVYTDASETGLGAVLVQKSDLGNEEVLAFASRSLNPAERNYAATELECLAVVWALEKWRTYLEGRLFRYGNGSCLSSMGV